MKRLAFIEKYASSMYSIEIYDGGDGARYYDEKHRNACMIEKELKKTFQVSVYTDLWAAARSHIPRDCRSRGNFDYIITHFPFDSVDIVPFTYDQSFSALERLRSLFPDTQVIVYTGASEEKISEDSLKEKGAAQVIRKSDDPKKDLEQMLKLLK